MTQYRGHMYDCSGAGGVFHTFSQYRFERILKCGQTLPAGRDLEVLERNVNCYSYLPNTILCAISAPHLSPCFPLGRYLYWLHNSYGFTSDSSHDENLWNPEVNNSHMTWTSKILGTRVNMFQVDWTQFKFWTQVWLMRSAADKQAKGMGILKFPILENPLLNLELADATFTLWQPSMIAVEKCNPMSTILVCGGHKLVALRVSEVQRIHNGSPGIKEGYCPRIAKNGRVVQPQFAYKGLEGRAWLIPETHLISILYLTIESNVCSSWYLSPSIQPRCLYTGYTKEAAVSD